MVDFTPLQGVFAVTVVAAVSELPRNLVLVCQNIVSHFWLPSQNLAAKCRIFI